MVQANLAVADETNAKPISPETYDPWKDVWVPHPTAERALKVLEWLYHKPKSVRPINMLLVGAPNSGKTMILRRFQRQMNENPEESHVTPYGPTKPIIYVQSPPAGDRGTLLSLMLRELSAPIPVSATPNRKREQLLQLLEVANTRMIMIDEVQNILATTQSRQELFLQELKFLSNELRVPLVCAGIIKAERAIQSDTQVGSRFDSFYLGFWRPNKTFAAFLVRLAKSLGFDGKEAFSNKDLVESICEQCEGRTGEARHLLAQAAQLAMDEGKTVLEPHMFNDLDWTKPSERRRAVDMADS